ncbi:hypothetical protein L2E82_31524 [Cichorium intybus]|uniref:Uncharacterized protein n=1 Tax=Cichorium intybus TaxID=13427 RepID=A0ACB9BEP1_CICIN|nr:hypothetical protein L2E82_31524 [Cichorium intybus]
MAMGEEVVTRNGMRWGKFLPKMVLRVLLVEPDDSTRQIITLLLRKCNYKVATVSDGLEAWELLNRKSNRIDLILTEVELPSISGFALLSLITEHDVCKNIPVIMMSAHDSVTTVYKCMLRGAADFLVKPVRKNELNNLWQHVWRRQALTSEYNEEEGGQATAETSNHKIKREKNEKGQICCGKPDMRCATVSLSPSKEAIDLIGSFGSCERSDPPSSMVGMSRSPSDPSSCSQVNEICDEKQRLKQSDASAFSRYINRIPLPCKQKTCDTPLPEHTMEMDCNPAASCEPESQTPFSSPNQSRLPVPSASLLPPPIFCIQPPINSSEPSLLQTNHYYVSFPEARSGAHNLRPPTFEDHQSGSDTNKTQREAALNRFRMKRKDRCYDKKVRYESRKKLAQQRPRVKGQFARHLQTSNTSNMEADIGCGN